MVSREDVIAAYRHFLGREPENEEVITGHQGHDSVAMLRWEILKSDEFAGIYQQISTDISMHLGAETFTPLPQIEC